MDRGTDRRRKFGAAPENVQAVRSFVREMASQSGADPDVAALLASELAANAVVHANSVFEVRVRTDGDVFRVEIVNDAPEMIAALKEPSEESGRGLHIVDALSKHWGTEAYDHEKAVWFELPTA